MDQMQGSYAAEELIAPAANVSNGKQTTRRGIFIVLSGRQPFAPLASPSTSARAAAATVTTKVRMKTEQMKDHMYQPAQTPAFVSRRERGAIFRVAITTKLSALVIPAVRESWTGAGKRRGRRRNVHIGSSDVFASAATKTAHFPQSKFNPK